MKCHRRRNLENERKNEQAREQQKLLQRKAIFRIKINKNKNGKYTETEKRKKKKRKQKQIKRKRKKRKETRKQKTQIPIFNRHTTQNGTVPGTAIVIHIARLGPISHEIATRGVAPVLMTFVAFQSAARANITTESRRASRGITILQN
jgi:hypothetical protein